MSSTSTNAYFVPTDDTLIQLQTYHAHPESPDAEANATKRSKKEGSGSPPPLKKPGRKPSETEPLTKRAQQQRAAQRLFRERRRNEMETLRQQVESLTSELQAATQADAALRAKVEKLEAENSRLRQMTFSFDFSHSVPSVLGDPLSDLLFSAPTLTSVLDLGSQNSTPPSDFSDLEALFAAQPLFIDNVTPLLPNMNTPATSVSPVVVDTECKPERSIAELRACMEKISKEMNDMAAQFRCVSGALKKIPSLEGEYDAVDELCDLFMALGAESESSGNVPEVCTNKVMKAKLKLLAACTDEDGKQVMKILNLAKEKHVEYLKEAVRDRRKM